MCGTGNIGDLPQARHSQEVFGDMPGTRKRGHVCTECWAVSRQGCMPVRTSRVAAIHMSPNGSYPMGAFMWTGIQR
jgi:hypothetical protein